MTKKFAFTLAEVLIALAIIGVVAAMTIPTFMANTAGAQFKTGFKKTIAVLTQAAAANYATEGYDFGTANGIYTAQSGSGSDAPVVPTPTYSLKTPIGEAVIGFDTETNPSANTDLGNSPSLFHLFQNNLNLKNSKEIQNYAVAGTPIELSCAGAAGDEETITLDDSVQISTGEARTVKSKGDKLHNRVDASTEAVREVMKSGGLADLCTPRLVSDGGINQGRMFQMEDGSVFTYDASQGYCTEHNPCYGYIDVNGPTGPNRVIGCTTGKDAWIPSYGRDVSEASLLANCTVENKDITDIFPVVFYNSTIKPASLAAKAVLYNTKSNQKITTTTTTTTTTTNDNP